MASKLYGSPFGTLVVSETPADLEALLDKHQTFVVVHRNSDSAEHHVKREAITGFIDNSIQ